jgi:hypothetical protein
MSTKRKLPPYMATSKLAKIVHGEEMDDEGSDADDDDDDDDTVYALGVEARFVPPDVLEVTTLVQFYAALRLLEYWMVTQLPNEVRDFAIGNEEVDMDEVRRITVTFVAEIHILVGHWATRMYDAAKAGYLELVKYLHVYGDAWSTNVYTTAVQNNRLEVVKYLYTNGCPREERAYRYAAEYGYMDMLKYMHENGYMTTSDVWLCNGAASNGQVEALKYLHEHGYPWSVWTYRYAEMFGHAKVTEYIRSQPAPQWPLPSNVNY